MFSGGIECAYKGVRNASFWTNVAYVLNGCLQNQLFCKITNIYSKPKLHKQFIIPNRKTNRRKYYKTDNRQEIFKTVTPALKVHAQSQRQKNKINGLMFKVNNNDRRMLPDEVVLCLD